jgi:hypothetical protein
MTPTALFALLRAKTDELQQQLFELMDRPETKVLSARRMPCKSRSPGFPAGPRLALEASLGPENDDR